MSKYLLLFVSIAFLLVQQSNCRFKFDNIELVQLIELSRHGARAPFYNLFDYQTNWDLPLQTLTNVGQRQHYLIGQEIYKRYQTTIFNNGNFNQSSVSVQSTSSNRAQQSALSQLYGIYQQKGKDMSQSWKFNAYTDLPPLKVKDGEKILNDLEGKNLPNSYVPINVQVPQDVNLLEPSDNCPGYDTLKALNYQTDVYKQFDEQNTAFKQEFIEKFGLQDQMKVSDVTIKKMSDYWDSVYCDIYQQIPLPANFTIEFIQRMNFIYDFQQLYLDFNSDNGDLLKIQSSTFFNDIIDVIRNQQDIKFKFYSASDNNLNAVLLPIGFSSYTTDFQEWLNPTQSPNHTNTPFASTIFFEIYQNKITKSKYIKVLYNDQPIHIKGCSQIVCDFENEFVPSMMKEAILPDSRFQQLCSA